MQDIYKILYWIFKIVGIMMGLFFIYKIYKLEKKNKALKIKINNLETENKALKKRTNEQVNIENGN